MLMHAVIFLLASALSPCKAACQLLASSASGEASPDEAGGDHLRLTIADPRAATVPISAALAEAAMTLGAFLFVMGVGHLLRLPSGKATSSAEIAAAGRQCNDAGSCPSQRTSKGSSLVPLGPTPARNNQLDLTQLLSSLRLCATWRRFEEALDAYDSAGPRVGRGTAAIWSMLLYCAVEAGQFQRCEEFFDRLRTMATLSSHDFLNMARYHAHNRDLAGLQRTVVYFMQRGCKVDAISRNRALSACCSTGALDLAEVLLAFGLCPEGPDAVAYNTVIKGYSKIGKLARCFELYEELRAAGVPPSEMTFGILLDTCNGANELDRAREVFADLSRSGLKLNVVHYTTFMKGLLSAGHLDDASAVLNLMLKSPDTAPDLVTYSMLVKAHADRGNVAESMRTLEQMMRQGIEPDAVVLNIVLGGCCTRPMPPAKVHQVLNRLMVYGLQPSTVTLSILVKAFVKSQAFVEALDLLVEAPNHLGVDLPEARLFTQLAQACARAGRGSTALKVYASMVQVTACRRGAFAVAEVSSARMSQICSSAGQASSAQGLHRAVIQALRSSEPAASSMLLAAAGTAAAAAAAAGQGGARAPTLRSHRNLPDARAASL